ncbi:MAG: thioredoxin family protein [Planctomycetota bacterium]|jgi:peroxiredoxin
MNTRTKRFALMAMAIAALGALTLAPANAQANKDSKAKIGEMAPDFELYDLDGTMHTLSQYTSEGKIVVLEWFNPDCPFVKKHHKHLSTMKDLATKYAEHDVVWLAINSGAEGKQGAGEKRNRKAVEDYAIAYPLLMDGSGDVGRMYGARTTPGMYVIDREGVLRYNGAIDDTPMASPKKLPKVNYVEAALDAVLAGTEVEITETKQYGCSVKY